MIFLKIVVGLVCLFYGGEWLVNGAVNAARRLGVSPLVIGITLVGFGTSTPELVTSIEAALRGSHDIAIGNIVGSNIANILLILGLTALLYPLPVHRGALKRDGTTMCLAALMLVVFAFAGRIGPVAGAVFIAALIAYVIYTYFSEKKSRDDSTKMHKQEAAVAEGESLPLAKAVALAVVGIALTVVGAKVLVSGAIDLARLAGISEAVIGLTIVAVGTSLPELAASIAAGLKRQGDVVIGNIVGSNIYNILGILGVTAIVKPLTISEQILDVDIWVMCAATAAAIVFSLTGGKISRNEGIALLAGYVAYIAYLAIIST